MQEKPIILNLNKNKYTPGKLLLIGNGGSLLKRRLGVFIDEFDGLIVRFNHFETAGLEAFAGSRTDIWVCHHGLKIEKKKNPEPMIIPQDQIKKIKKYFKNYFPSTGAIAMSYFADQGFDVWITGFDCFTSELHHYYGLGDKGHHHSEYEIMFIEKLLSEGKIKLFCEFSSPVMTIIVPFHDEGLEPLKTIRSLQENTPENSYKIIMIDDFSSHYRDGAYDGIKNLKYIRNRKRLGVDCSRTIGGYMADTEYLLFIDAHMRFSPGWLDRFVYALDRWPQSIVYCKTDFIREYPDHPNIKQPAGKQMYYSDFKLNRNGEILSTRWTDKEPEEIFTEVTGVMGANYGMKNDWFRYIRGFEGLRLYGVSEEYIALKDLYLGGKIIYIKDVIISHLYKHIATHVPSKEYYIYNQMFTLRSLLPWNEVKRLEKKIPESKYKTKAEEMIKYNHKAIMLFRKQMNRKKAMSFKNLVDKYEL